MALIIIGSVILVVGVLLLMSRQSNQSKIEQVVLAEARTVGGLEEIAKAVANELGAGSFQEFVELSGVVECNEPLVSELSETECVYYRMSVDRHFEEISQVQAEPVAQINEEDEIETQAAKKPMTKPVGKMAVKPVAKPVGKPAIHPGGKGVAKPAALAEKPPVKAVYKPGQKGFEKASLKTPLPQPDELAEEVTEVQSTAASRKSENIARRVRSCTFYLTDETGTIEVQPEGADIDAQRVVSSSESEASLVSDDPSRLRYGAFVFARPDDETESRRTLSYDLEEWLLPTGTTVYILGEVSDRQGQLAVHSPSDPSHKFLISTQSKGALIQSLKHKVRTLTISALVALIAGGGLLLAGIIQKVVG